MVNPLENMTKWRRPALLWVALVWVALAQLWSGVALADEPRCLLLYSYHPGYEWNDGIDHGATQVLDGECEIQRFFLDSKRNKSPEWIQQKAAEAVALIESWRPDVVIAADDNASKYVVEPYLKGGDIPVLFCGINWEAKRYGFPARNVTGMVEVSPIIPLIKVGMQVVAGRATKAHYLAANVVTEQKEFVRFEREFAQRGIKLVPHLVEDFEQWKAVYREVQHPQGLLIFSNDAGIRNWDQKAAERWVQQHGKIFTISANPWMSKLSHLTMGKVAEEQGSWAGQRALEVLQGRDIHSLAMTTNKQWTLDVNRQLLSKHRFRLPGWVEKRLKRQK